MQFVNKIQILSTELCFQVLSMINISLWVTIWEKLVIIKVHCSTERFAKNSELNLKYFDWDQLLGCQLRSDYCTCVMISSSWNDNLLSQFTIKILQLICSITLFEINTVFWREQKINILKCLNESAVSQMFKYGMFGRM